MAEPARRGQGERPGDDPGGDTMTPADHLSRGDMVLIRRAFRNGWNVPSDQQQRIVAELEIAIRDPFRSARDKQKAQETLDLIQDRLDGRKTER